MTAAEIALRQSGNPQYVIGPGTDGGFPAPASSSTTAATIANGSKAVTTAGTPVRLVAVSTLVESVEIHARKNPTTANTGAIYIGLSGTGGQNFRVLAPGESFTISAPAGKKIDLNTIFVDSATSADAVAYTSVN